MRLKSFIHKSSAISFGLGLLFLSSASFSQSAGAGFEYKPRVIADILDEDDFEDEDTFTVQPPLIQPPLITPSVVTTPVTFTSPIPQPQQPGVVQIGPDGRPKAPRGFEYVELPAPQQQFISEPVSTDVLFEDTQVAPRTAPRFLPEDQDSYEPDRNPSEMNPFLLGAHFGTLGAGIHSEMNINSRFGFGVALDAFGIRADNDNTDLDDLKVEAENLSVSLLANFHPGGGGFRISGGMQIGAPRFDASATSSFDNSGNTVPISMAYDLKPESDFGPYLGIGYTKSSSRSGLSVYSDLGFAYMGGIDDTFVVSADCSDYTGGQSACQSEIDEFRDAVENADGDYFYPIFRLGISYRF